MTKKINIEKNGLNPSQAEHLLMAAKSATESLLRLEALFKSIMEDTKESTLSTANQLAKLGNYYAMDQANIAECFIEQLETGEVA